MFIDDDEDYDITVDGNLLFSIENKFIDDDEDEDDEPLVSIGSFTNEFNIDDDDEYVGFENQLNIEEPKTFSLIVKENKENALALINQDESLSLVVASMDTLSLLDARNQVTKEINDYDLYNQIVGVVSVNHTAELEDGRLLNEKVINLTHNLIQRAIDGGPVPVEDYIKNFILDIYTGLKEMPFLYNNLREAILKFYNIKYNMFVTEQDSVTSKIKDNAYRRGVTPPSLIGNKHYICELGCKFGTAHYIGTMLVTGNDVKMINDVVYCDRKCNNEDCSRVLALPDFIYHSLNEPLKKDIIEETNYIDMQEVRYRRPLTIIKEIIQKTGYISYFDLEEQIDIINDIKEYSPKYNQSIYNMFFANVTGYHSIRNDKNKSEKLLVSSDIDSVLIGRFTSTHLKTNGNIFMYDFVKSIIHIFETEGFLTLTYNTYLSDKVDRYTMPEKKGIRLTLEDTIKFLQDNIAILSSVKMVSKSKESYIQDIKLAPGITNLINQAFMYRVLLDNINPKNCPSLYCYDNSNDTSLLKGLVKSVKDTTLSKKGQIPLIFTKPADYILPKETMADYSKTPSYLGYITAVIVPNLYRYIGVDWKVLARLLVLSLDLYHNNTTDKTDNAKYLLTSDNERVYSKSDLIKLIYCNMKDMPEDVSFSNPFDFEDRDTFTLDEVYSNDKVDVEELLNSTQFTNYLRSLGLDDLCNL